MKKLSEDEIVNLYIKKKNLSNFIKEKRYGATRIDLSFLKKDNLYAIEFKKHDFKKVFIQAIRLQYSFNYVFICINLSKIMKPKLEICKENNIGLIVFDEIKQTFKILYKPLKRKIILNLIDKRSYLTKELQKNQ